MGNALLAFLGVSLVDVSRPWSQGEPFVVDIGGSVEIVAIEILKGPFWSLALLIVPLRHDGAARKPQAGKSREYCQERRRENRRSPARFAAFWFHGHILFSSREARFQRACAMHGSRLKKDYVLRLHFVTAAVEDDFHVLTPVPDPKLVHHSAVAYEF